MDLIHTIVAMQAAADAARQHPPTSLRSATFLKGRGLRKRLGLVPTMGALHGGHLALVREAKKQADHVTVSIFVNPTQFAPGEDYEEYPRTLEADMEALESIGRVDVVFAPSAEEMYPFGLPPFATVSVRDLDKHLCGAFREGHFEGVTSVVTRLFLACRPDIAVFGQKDAQQLAILKRMTAELDFGIEIIGCPIVREEDGLAISSRNRYLGSEERRQATVLSQAVRNAFGQVEKGERDVTVLIDTMQQIVASAPLARLQYAEIVDAENLQPVRTLRQGRYLAALAVFFGDTRLIDNTTLEIAQ